MHSEWENVSKTMCQNRQLCVKLLFYPQLMYLLLNSLLNQKPFKSNIYLWVMLGWLSKTWKVSVDPPKSHE